MIFRAHLAQVRYFPIALFLSLSPIVFAQANAPTITIRHVGVLNHAGNFELEIDASHPITPKTQVITGPDRLVIDFPNAVPGPQLHAIAVGTREIKGVRSGLFASNPPVARVVIDLNSPQAYEVFPSGNSVIVKIGENKVGGKELGVKAGTEANQAHLATVSSSSGPVPPTSAATSPISAPPAPDQPKPPPPLQVDFANGKLRVWTDHAMLGDVLRAIGQQTGAAISMPPQADRDPVIAHLGPAPPREVLSALLDGVAYNVVLVGAGSDLSRVTSIVLTSRNSSGASAPANYAPAPVQDAAPEPDNPPQPAPVEPENSAPQAPDALPPPPQ